MVLFVETRLIEKCGTCQQTKPTLSKEKAPLGKYMAGEPMERIGIEVMGL